MKLGTRSILFGVHQFLWHPLTVLIAWRRLFGRPSWKEVVCILIHDWGYWGCPNIDGPRGEKHTELGARLAAKWLGAEHGKLCLYHSRHYAQQRGVEPSKLCWADKLSIQYEPWWFYLVRAQLSGELFEYRRNAARVGLVPLSASHREWFTWIKQKLAAMGKSQDKNAMPYVRSILSDLHREAS